MCNQEETADCLSVLGEMLPGLKEQGLKRVQLASLSNVSLTAAQNGGPLTGMVGSLYTRPGKGKMQRLHKGVQQETRNVEACVPQTKLPVLRYYKDAHISPSV